MSRDVRRLWLEVERVLGEFECELARVEAEALGRDRDLRAGQAVLVDWMESFESPRRRADA